uniref:Putative secreted protein n=1 Tax=Ixodes ricinus TaxID=34613 RepID=A0A6B0U840_IXORI
MCFFFVLVCFTRCFLCPYQFQFGLMVGRPHAFSSGKEDQVLKERRRTQQREWVRNCRGAAVASTSTASSASDSLAADEHIARPKSQLRTRSLILTFINTSFLP